MGIDLAVHIPVVLGEGGAGERRREGEWEGVVLERQGRGWRQVPSETRGIGNGIFGD